MTMGQRSWSTSWRAPFSRGTIPLRFSMFSTVGLLVKPCATSYRAAPITTSAWLPTTRCGALLSCTTESITKDLFARGGTAPCATAYPVTRLHRGGVSYVVALLLGDTCPGMIVMEEFSGNTKPGGYLLCEHFLW